MASEERGLTRRAAGLSQSRLSGSGGQVYCLQREVGSGTFAVVYRCVDERDPKRTVYACKVIDKSTLGSERDRENMIREIKILRRVSHPNVLSLHDLLETQDFLFLIMPLFVVSTLLFYFFFFHSRSGDDCGVQTA